MTRKSKTAAAAIPAEPADLTPVASTPVTIGGTASTDAVPPARLTKSAVVVALLGRTEGATLAELIAATGWLPHTTRAALTGLKKKGHAIERGKRGDATCYRIAAAA